MLKIGIEFITIENNSELAQLDERLLYHSALMVQIPSQWNDTYKGICPNTTAQNYEQREKVILQ